MSSKKSILIIDDHPLFREGVAKTLVDLGPFEVVGQGTNASEAVTLAQQLLPDLMLLDIMMPKMDGLEVCRRLKGDSSLPFMPIIMVTAIVSPMALPNANIIPPTIPEKAAGIRTRKMVSQRVAPKPKEA